MNDVAGRVINSAWTVAGNPIWKTAVGDAFGGANTALYFNGSSRIEISAAESERLWDFGTNDCTIESWFNYEGAMNEDRNIITRVNYGGGGSQNQGGFWLSIGAGNSNNMRLYGKFTSGGTTAHSVNTPDHITAFQWHHCALQRTTGGLVSLYYDGVLVDTETGVTANMVNEDCVTTIGRYSVYDGYYYKGYIDGLRISNGICRYGSTTLANTQQVVTSSNSDSQVVTANSTGGSATNLFTADAYTAILLQ